MNVTALPGLLRSSTTAVWVLLMAATVGSWLLGTDNLVHGAKIASVLVLVVAFVKVRFVIRHFMEIHAAPTPLRLILDGYVVVVCTALVIMFLTNA